MAEPVEPAAVAAEEEVPAVSPIAVVGLPVVGGPAVLWSGRPVVPVTVSVSVTVPFEDSVEPAEPVAVVVVAVVAAAAVGFVALAGLVELEEPEELAGAKV